MNKPELKMKDIFRKTVALTMTQVSRADKYAQVSMKEGIKRHEYKALDAVFKEFAQLDNKTIFDPQDANDLSSTAKYEALNLLTMVKEQRDGNIKGRSCADGWKQHLYIVKEDVSSPAVQLESLKLSLLIYAYEGKDMKIVDVVGAYLLVDIEDYVFVKLSGTR